MFSSIRSLIVLFTIAIAALGAAIPSRLQWSTPSSCLRGLATYHFKKCTIELNDLIRLAHAGMKDIDIVGMKLVDVIGPAAVRWLLYTMAIYVNELVLQARLIYGYN